MLSAIHRPPQPSVQSTSNCLEIINSKQPIIGVRMISFSTNYCRNHKNGRCDKMIFAALSRLLNERAPSELT